ncbi:MAG: DNA ligase D [Rhodospirillaceae bacterium]|nr:DNA ligase D [Rhodospirillaceae bacterium]
MALRRPSRHGSLAGYHAKRHFSRTGEPRGALAGNAGRSFVIQKHGARRLHYDFRLEWGGTLKSWAVPKGPSLNPADKRLAVRVEDHPVDYGAFEGVIPEGEYGAGPVIVWDRGTWRPEGDPDRAVAKGRINFVLDGEKLHGAWSLVRLGGRNGDAKNWLLIKRTDAMAQRGGRRGIVDAKPKSVLSDRALEELRSAPASDTAQRRAAKARKPRAGHVAEARSSRRRGNTAMPDFVPPELATRVTKPPASSDWLHEVKFDGYRVQVRIETGDVRLLTRTGLDWTERFADLVPELRRLGCARAIVDGEIVVLASDGASDFSRLQEALAEGNGAALMLYAFDLLYLDREDLRHRPLRERKQVLARLLRHLDSDGRVRFSEHFEVAGATFFRHVCSLALEGAVSKRADAPYISGRSGDWLKSKCVEREEMIVIGFTPGTTGPHAIGSLLLAQPEDGKLVYRGRVGTGFTHASARALRKRLDALAADAAAADVPRRARKDALWVAPQLVAEIEFGAWTADRVVRHAAFKGLRDDKPAELVTQEKVERMPSPRRGKAKLGRDALFADLTHPDRVLYDAQGVTKQGLADYYAEVAKLMLPHVAGRPLSLVRCPAGTSGQCFYQKSIPAGTPSGVSEVRNAVRGKKETYPAIRDLAGLIGLVQMGTLEIHTWGCKASKIMTPDRIVFDLDPDAGIAWTEIVAAAREIRERLTAIKLESFLKTTGGKGLHVAVPIAPRHPWETVKAFTKAFAHAMMRDSPDRYVVNVSKNARKGKIFIDYLRNGYGATFVAPYSPRARPSAPVSTPLDWRELTPAIRSDHFRIDNFAARLKALRVDPWAPLLRRRQGLTAKILRAYGLS